MDASLEGAPVTITFSVPDIPVLPATKALEDGEGDITGTPYLDPDKMYLVVCGSSQSIKYIRKATLVSTQDGVEIPQEHFPLTEGDRITTLYTFSVQLELSDQPRTIHILGNVDENQLITGSYSYQSLPGMLSFDNKQAYWQKLSVPYIKAKIAPDTHEPVKQDGHYVPDDETLGFFQYVPLIRNFAKIQVTNASENFQLHSYAVIYYPERGSVVPYRTNEPVAENRFDFNPPTGYIFSGYEKSSFEQLEEDINYLGNMPASVALSDVIPPASEFEDPSTSAGRVLLYDENDTDSGFYVYERGIPNDHIGPTFIIVCGKFNNEDDYYYYRLDLMESKVENNQTISRYYPIYRNFRYNIQLHRISSEGVLTPEAAANSSGAEDISADVSMRHLSDISNGTTRLVVEPFMTRTYSGPAEEGSYYELYARFFNDVYSDVPNLNTAAVRVELEPMEGGEDDILILYDGNGNRVPTRGFFFPEAATVGGVEGIRTIRFNTVEPLDETKMQKIKITGHNPGNHQDLRLYREVEITLQKKQPLKVSCESPVLLAAGTPLTVDITVPSELPESMFPLEFIVEPEAMTLTPDTSHDEINLPVHSGRSIATTESVFTDTPAFYYIRTLTWEEFSGLAVNAGERTFSCYFKSNKALSATTIWVYNEFFSKASASFNNQAQLSLTCTDPVMASADSPLALGLTVYSNLPESLFPLEFIVEPEAMTITPDVSHNSLPVVTGPSIATNETTFKDTEADHFIRTLTWDEYSSLPESGNKRTFYCFFKSIVPQSATTIWAYNGLFSKASVSFQNVEPYIEPDNHFWVYAVDNCTVIINYNGLKYKLDDGNWLDYVTNAPISLDAGHKVSFKAGSATKKKTWKVNGAFSGTGGRFKVGGNFASLLVGDDYPTNGSDGTSSTFIDFFKNTGALLIDAYDLELPMMSLTTNAYKSMFDSCTNLERGPQILPATSLGNTCYRNMFYNCANLENAPVLAATTLSQGCYQRMFYGCAKINYIKMLGTNWQQDAFISDNTTWTAGVASSGELWLDASLQNDSNWDKNKIIPPGWSVKYVGIDDQ